MKIQSISVEFSKRYISTVAASCLEVLLIFNGFIIDARRCQIYMNITRNLTFSHSICSFSSAAITCAGACTSRYGWQGNITHWTSPCFRRCWCLLNNLELFRCWGGWHVAYFETVYITEAKYIDIFIAICKKWLPFKNITKTWTVTFIYTCNNTWQFNVSYKYLISILIRLSRWCHININAYNFHIFF